MGVFFAVAGAVIISGILLLFLALCFTDLDSHA